MRAVAFVCSIVLFLVAPGVPPAGAATPWLRPVDGRVARPFDPPATRFGAGHLGVDLAAARGAPVRAAAAGVVTFAGRVAGALHVVVAHAGGLRTSYSFLATLRVHRDERVDRGDVVGTSGGTGEGHDGTVVHLGLRAGDTYVDPMRLFAPPDLAAIVHLAPTTTGPVAAPEPTERRGLIAGFAHDAGRVGRLVRGGVDAGRAAVSAVGSAAAALGRRAAAGLQAAFPVPVAAARGLREWLRERGRCDPHAPAADGTGGSGHRVMVVAGIESARTDGGAPLALPVAALGYRPDEVDWFSYANGGGDYGPPDTEGPVLGAARRLAEQLRRVQRRDPGREVDLLAHSQGGVVVEAFLALVYDPGDSSYPPLGTVVTLSAPLAGDPLAGAIRDIRRSAAGRAVLQRASDGAGRVGVRLPAPGSAAVRDLAAGSRLMRRLDAAHLPDQVDLTTIGAATDFVVPADASSRPGARRTVVVPRALEAHSGILRDPAALRAVRAALEDRPLPCRSLATAIAGEVAPAVISRLERGAGLAGETAGRAVDALR